MNRTEALRQLQLAGWDAGSDFNDGLEPRGGYFAWDIIDDDLEGKVFLSASHQSYEVDALGDPTQLTKMRTHVWELVPVDD